MKLEQFEITVKIHDKPAARKCISNLERNEKVHQHFGVNPREYQRYERWRTRRQREIASAIWSEPVDSPKGWMRVKAKGLDAGVTRWGVIA